MLDSHDKNNNWCFYLRVNYYEYALQVICGF